MPCHRNAGVDRPTKHHIASLTLNFPTKYSALSAESFFLRAPWVFFASTQASLTFTGTLLPTQRHLASLGLARSGGHQQHSAETSPGDGKRDRCDVVAGLGSDEITKVQRGPLLWEMLIYFNWKIDLSRWGSVTWFLAVYDLFRWRIMFFEFPYLHRQYRCTVLYMQDGLHAYMSYMYSYVELILWTHICFFKCWC